MAQETNTTGSQSAPTPPKTVATAAAPATGPSPVRAVFADFATALAELKRLEALPEATTKQQRDKASLLAPVRKAVFDMQQGLPVQQPDAHELATQAATMRPILERMAIEALASQHPIVAQFLKDFDALAARVESLRTGK